jgi:hypothetical protein
MATGVFGDLRIDPWITTCAWGLCLSPACRSGALQGKSGSVVVLNPQESFVRCCHSIAAKVRMVASVFTHQLFSCITPTVQTMTTDTHPGGARGCSDDALTAL